jgi:hypothetical protein
MHTMRPFIVSAAILSHRGLSESAKSRRVSIWPAEVSVRDNLLWRCTSSLLGKVLLLSFLSAIARADSRLPPSNPGAAIRVGSLDIVRDTPSRPWRLLPCVGYDVNLNVNDRLFNTQYFHFSLSIPRSRVIVQMREDPSGSLWFELLDRNLGLIQSYSGGQYLNNQRFERDDLEPGEYYVRVVTNSSMRRRQDGTNRAFVVLRGIPKGLFREPEADPMNLGSLTPNQVLSRSGTVYMFHERNLDFTPTVNNRNCPPAEGPNVQPTDMYDEYVMQAPSGTVNVNVNIATQQNWPPQYPFRVHFLQRGNLGDQWLEVQSGRLSHGGGELRLRVGHWQQPVFHAPDAYVDYEIRVSLTDLGPPGTSPGPPGVPITIDLGPPPRPPTVIIGPIPR